MDERMVYGAALQAVAEHAGVETATLMSGDRVQRAPYWVGAMRWVLFKLLTERGMRPTAISRLSGKSFNAVDYVLRRWDAKAMEMMPDPEGPCETYAEALYQCRMRMDEILDDHS